MRFIFYHHGIQGPINLRDLDRGEVRYGGSVARLRLLFWIAKRRNDVHLVGNVESGEWRGVRAEAGEKSLEILLGMDRDRDTVLVVNDPPEGIHWNLVKGLKNGNTRVIIWAGVPFHWEWLRRVKDNEVDRIVCVSRCHREAYRRYPGFEKIEVSYSGVDMDLMCAAPVAHLPGNVVLTTSAPRRTKGFHNILHAWRKIRVAVPESRLRVCGSASMHDPNADLGPTRILDADLEFEFPDFFGNPPHSIAEARIDLMGARPLSEVYSDLKAATVAVVNGNWRGSFETYCRAAVEAQVSGIPVVGAARGSLTEVVVDRKTGLLVEKEDPAALAEAIIALLKDKELRCRLGTEGKEWSKPFADFESIAPDWEGIARRAWSKEQAHAQPSPLNDLLRQIGYGSARLWVREKIMGDR